jgi:hypothetical protein
MTMRVTMRNPRRSEDGLSVLLVGTIYTVSDEFGQALVQANHAVDTDNVIPTEDAAARDDLLPAEVRLTRSLVSGARNTEILTGAVAGEDSGWLRINGPEALAWQLVSGTTNTTFQIDVSATADGASPTMILTGNYASSTVIERSWPLFNLAASLNANYFRFSVLSGGPLTVIRNA